jgi:predicted RNA-binding Zn-ribbon protein involved in translation (DUF1610 family)
MTDGLGTPARDCREEFRPVAAKRRKMSRLLAIITLPAFGFWLLLWTGRDRQIGRIGFFVCSAIGFIGYFLLPKITCPSCHHKVDQEADFFCPECGSSALERGSGFFSVTRCRSCRKDLLRAKGERRYKIWFCAVCGAHLDDTGL